MNKENNTDDNKYWFWDYGDIMEKKYYLEKNDQKLHSGIKMLSHLQNGGKAAKLNWVKNFDCLEFNNPIYLRAGKIQRNGIEFSCDNIEDDLWVLL